MERLPKLHLICSKDDLMPTMCHVYIDEEYVVATNSVALVRYSRKIIDSMVEGLPWRRYIHPSEWVKMTKEFKSAVYENGLIKVVDKKDNAFIVTTLDVEAVGVYPRYGGVLRKDLRAGSIDSIGLNPWLLKEVAEAMNLDYSKTGDVTIVANFEDDNKVIMLTHTGYGEDDILGLLMPKMKY